MKPILSVLHASTRSRSTLHGLRLALASAAAVLLTHAALAQTWQTVDDFQYVSGASAQAITVNGLGNVFVGGWGSDGTSGHWLVRKR